MLTQLRRLTLLSILVLPLAVQAGRPALGEGTVQTAHTSQVAPASRLRLGWKRTPPKPHEDKFGDRMADKVSSFAGSWKFIASFSVGMAAWITYNSIAGHPFDAPPYVGLNLILSTVAALQAPFILMSGNRQADKDRRMAAKDLQVNVETEHEVQHLHLKLDTLSEDVRRLTAALAEKQEPLEPPAKP